MQCKRRYEKRPILRCYLMLETWGAGSLASSSGGPYAVHRPSWLFAPSLPHLQPPHLQLLTPQFAEYVHQLATYNQDRMPKFVMVIVAHTAQQSLFLISAIFHTQPPLPPPSFAILDLNYCGQGWVGGGRDRGLNWAKSQSKPIHTCHLTKFDH